MKGKVKVSIPRGMELVNGSTGNVVNGAGFQLKRSAKKVGRNENCSCGSGLKYKKCCFQN